MKCRISRDLLDRCAAEAQAAMPEEACGLLLGTPSLITGAVPIHNVAGDPIRGFEIEPREHLAAQRAARAAGTAVIGCYHSHPGGKAEPSSTDARRAIQPGFYWLILAEQGASLSVERAGGAIMGVFDPVMLEIV